MKLYAIQPNWHGQKNFFVCAGNVGQAQIAVNAYIYDNKISGYGANGLYSDDYSFFEVNPMVVIENGND